MSIRERVLWGVAFVVVLPGILLIVAWSQGGDGGSEDPAQTVESSSQGGGPSVPAFTEQANLPPVNEDNVGDRIDPIPAALDRDGRQTDPVCQGGAQWPVKNGWVAANHRYSTIVTAGGHPVDSSKGTFCIVREDHLSFKQGMRIVVVRHSGPVQITDAPEGRGRIQISAQRRGKFRFRGETGVTGTLDLRTDRVTLDG